MADYLSTSAISPNLAVWLYGKDDLRFLPYELPTKLGPNDVRVEMKAVGICGSDVHYLKRMRIADFVVKEPMVIGHESAGVVIEVGTDVRHLEPGDRVALEPGIACNKCRICKEGRYNLCSSMKFFATPPIHGSLARQVVHPSDLAFKLPDSISLEEGAMCEPLSVGVHACRRAGITAGAYVLVLGAGPIGLVNMLVARAFGASFVAITDVDAKRLERAKELGADFTLLVSSQDETLEAEVQALKCAFEQAGAEGSDAALDCVGLSKTMNTALQVARSGSRVVLVGMAGTNLTLPLATAAIREVDILGSFRYRNTYPLALELLRTGKVDVNPLITHRFNFNEDEVRAAFEKSESGGACIKAMFVL